MSLFDRKLASREEDLLDLSLHNIEVVLSPAEAVPLGSPDMLATGMSMTVNPMPPDQPVPDEIAARAKVLLVEICANSPASVARIERIRQSHPDLPIVAAMRDADIALVRSLLRRGVRDVIELPLSPQQLGEAIGDILLGARPTPSQEARRGQLISIIKSTGGVGATNVAVHLATALAQGRSEGRTCLFDLDVQFGNAGNYLGAPATPSLSELLDGGARVDGEFLRTVTSPLPSSLKFVPPPPHIGPLEGVDSAQLQRILQVARAEFDHVVVDLPGNWANWTLSVVDQSDLTILVVNLTIASLRQGKRQLQLFQAQGIAADRILILVNRVEQRLFKSISLDDAAKALGHPVTLAVHNDYALVNTANNQGLAVWDINRKSRVARDFVHIAETLPQTAIQGA